MHAAVLRQALRVVRPEQLALQVRVCAFHTQPLAVSQPAAVVAFGLQTLVLTLHEARIAELTSQYFMQSALKALKFESSPLTV